MRITALCVCGTLLAFTSLFWTTADSDEGDLLWDNEFGPCTANLRPEGPCRHRQDESTCPYLFSLPPLTVHLPKQLRELEKIVEDLQKLKDNVDQLRKMCADCKERRQYGEEGKKEMEKGIKTERNNEKPKQTESIGHAEKEKTIKEGEVERDWESAMEIKTEGEKAVQTVQRDGDGELASSEATERTDFVSISPTPHSTISLAPRHDSMDSDKAVTFASPPSSSSLTSHLNTVTLLRRDCSEYRLREETKSGVYLVTPDLRGRSFRVFCDMELDGGGWTVLQRRQDGSVSFNRTWAEYRSGFGELDGGEFWLGNNLIHLLTRDGDMVLRVELEDFDGVMEHAEYEQFRVANERLRYRLTVGRYLGTAGDALRFSKSYDHNNRAFTTPDRDHDRYPSGNCGAYYSSGWWFDACMAANLNGRYYVGKYKGVRDGIFWGTWHNISTEYYLTSYRQSFKTVRMMIRPKGFTP
ncbi:Fibroleukin Fibrinogen-like protein 2 [Collichthys lucidus]|uniref:Fibroleukin Fibrinogen-like protein 2 n=1 Tax=Collichthys lucidus TaxID=240159 RepID=A0A4U5UF84_COLLU|nr:Fibroleukin Fibrinogen-like protein 2 [Collichthys lucidus]